MKATKAWSVAGLFFVAALSSVSCGKDEGTGGTGGTGNILTGGSGGSSAGTRSGGGSGGTASGNTKLGMACLTERDCADPDFPELTCITSKDAVLGNGAPPKGLCTMPCSLPTADAPEDACEALGTGAICFPFNDGEDKGYCVEGCSFGEPDLGQPQKCHGRSEFACNPALLGATSATCASSAECQLGELCSQGRCNVILPACLPSCAGDIDCDSGYYCDQSFLSGVCVKGTAKGKALGEPCTVPGANEPDEPDECLGYCAPDTQGSTKGHCVSTCTYGAPCAWNSGTEKFDGACILVNRQIVGSSPGTGDFGFCDLTCNCAADCMDATLGCEVIDQPLPAENFRGGGFCLEPADMSVPYDQCTGAGGAAGAGAGGGGSGGADAGAPGTDGGAPAGGAGG